MRLERPDATVQEGWRSMVTKTSAVVVGVRLIPLGVAVLLPSDERLLGLVEINVAKMARKV